LQEPVDAVSRARDWLSIVIIRRGQVAHGTDTMGSIFPHNKKWQEFGCAPSLVMEVAGSSEAGAGVPFFHITHRNGKSLIVLHHW
jgi:hypothetical protein